MLFQKHKISNRIKNFLLIFLSFLIIYSAKSQRAISLHGKKVNQFAASINSQDLYRHIEVLTSDSLEGRETGEPGQKKAAAYLKNQFRRMGLLPVSLEGKETYEQVFALKNKRKQKVSLIAAENIFFHSSDFIHGGRFNQVVQDTLNLVFTGYGNPDDLEKIVSPGRAVFFLQSGPGINFHEKIDLMLKKGFEYIFISYGNNEDEFDQFLQVANRYENTSESWSQDQIREGHIFFIPPRLGSLIMDTEIDRLIKAADKSLKGAKKPFSKLNEASVILSANPEDSLVYTENILGFIEGADKPDECVIISAHYDHLGKSGDQIYRGADDNASGTASLMEVAEAFSLARKAGSFPSRSILFIAFTGEEKGLLGSNFYVGHPVFSLDETVLNLNIDMIGRSESMDSSYVYLIGSDKLSLELHEISEKINSTYTKLILDYTYNDDQDPNRFYYRSDHYNFARNRIPILFYFTGTHEDYHRPSDTIEKIRFDNMVKISRLVFYTAWEIADRKERLKME